MRYTKQTITLSEQIETLQKRGLIIEDEKEALSVLEQISYFRLADYWRPLETTSYVNVYISPDSQKLFWFSG